MAFCKKWGGGASQRFSLDICEVVKAVGGGKIVGAATFDYLTRLSLPGDSLCPFFIAAMVKCAAMRGKQRDGVSMHIQAADVKSISEILPALREAEELMQKAFNIQQKLGASRSTYFYMLSDYRCLSNC